MNCCIALRCVGRSNARPAEVVEWRHNQFVQVLFPIRHAFFHGDVFHGFGVNRFVGHQGFFGAVDSWFVSVTIDSKFDVRVGDVSAVDAWSSAVVFVTINGLQFVVCFLLGWKQCHLSVAPSVVAPFTALVVCLFDFLVGGQSCAVCFADGLGVFVPEGVFGDVEDLFVNHDFGHGVGFVDDNVDFGSAREEIAKIHGEVNVQHKMNIQKHQKQEKNQDGHGRECKGRRQKGRRRRRRRRRRRKRRRKRRRGTEIRRTAASVATAATAATKHKHHTNAQEHNECSDDHGSCHKGVNPHFVCCVVILCFFLCIANIKKIHPVFGFGFVFICCFHLLSLFVFDWLGLV